jgi:hypothetical protein
MEFIALGKSTLPIHFALYNPTSSDNTLRRRRYLPPKTAPSLGGDSGPQGLAPDSPILAPSLTAITGRALQEDCSQRIPLSLRGQSTCELTKAVRAWLLSTLKAAEDP